MGTIVRCARDVPKLHRALRRSTVVPEKSTELLAKRRVLRHGIVARLLLMTGHPPGEHDERDLNGQRQHDPDASLLGAGAKNSHPRRPSSDVNTLK